MNHPESLFVAVRLPRPSPALRVRTLARVAVTAPSPAEASWIDRLWESRRLRLAWLVAMLTLLGANVRLTPGAWPGVSRGGVTLEQAWAALRAPGLPLPSGARRS